MSEPVTVFDRAHLGAWLLRPDAPNSRLLATFRHRIPAPGQFSPPNFSRRFLQAGWTQLHLQSRLNDWYINDETTSLSQTLAPLVASFGHRVGIGFSMGGYAALRLSAVLALDEVVAVSPQVSIAPAIVPFDPRFRAEALGFDPVLGDLSAHARKDLRGVVIFDPFRPLDLTNARMIQAVMPDLALCRYGFGGHPATGTLRETVSFGAIQGLILKGELTARNVLAAHRNHRAGSPSWWRALAVRAEKTGHHALAQQAHARAAF